MAGAQQVDEEDRRLRLGIRTEFRSPRGAAAAARVGTRPPRSRRKARAEGTFSWTRCAVDGVDTEAVDGAQWAVGGGQWAVGSGQWAVGSGQWAVGSGRWGSGRWARHRACCCQRCAVVVVSSNDHPRLTLKLLHGDETMTGQQKVHDQEVRLLFESPRHSDAMAGGRCPADSMGDNHTHSTRPTWCEPHAASSGTGRQRLYSPLDPDRLVSCVQRNGPSGFGFGSRRSPATRA